MHRAVQMELRLTTAVQSFRCCCINAQTAVCCCLHDLLPGRLGEAAPTLLLIRDKGGAVFGGIAHQPWKKTGTFYGTCTAGSPYEFELLLDQQPSLAVCIFNSMWQCNRCWRVARGCRKLKECHQEHSSAHVQLFCSDTYSVLKTLPHLYSAGDYASSIFSLLPSAHIYPASGINPNIQWCGIGFTQLPNGVGFGGQVGHFGVWLDATLDTGMSRPAATYAR